MSITWLLLRRHNRWKCDENLTAVPEEPSVYSKGRAMKKGLCFSVILFFWIVCNSQNALATGQAPLSQGTSINATLVLNITANPNALPADKLSWGNLDPQYGLACTNNSTAANLGASNSGSYTVTWKEKALYGSGTISPIFTVRNLVQGDLIVRLDWISSNAANDNADMTDTPYWLKYGSGFSGIQMCSNNTAATGSPTTVNAANMPTLALATGLPANTTTTLFSFTTSGFNVDGEVIISAFLVDNVAAASPQVIGMDTQTAFFAPVSWLDVIKATNQ